MRTAAFSPSNHWNATFRNSHFTTQRSKTNADPFLFNTKNPLNHRQVHPPFPSFSINPSKNPPIPISQDPNFHPLPLVVVGSANADIYVEIERLPNEGETISATSGQTLAGGKGANQAACGGKLRYPTYFLGQVGEDAHGKLVSQALEDSGVNLDHLNIVSGTPTGHAVVMLQSDGQNSIIIIGGTNMCSWPEVLPDEDLELVKNAGIVLLQREIPDFVNNQVAKAARSAGVPVILDAGGMDTPIPRELLSSVDIFSPNETELARLTAMPTESFEQICQAVAKFHEMGIKQVLLKLGDKGSALFIEGENPIKQPIIKAKKVLDTTGAGDTFTAAFAVAHVEGKSKAECLRFAAAAAALCVQAKGAIPSMPVRESVSDLLQSL
ncbi:ribokinase isoform X1 [Rhodamnia argentea]|uniref:Ribokinase n=1 Tax=Rhodamnia argentea TaxID=178133 RepID=A0A8B8NTI2_9MYRT|nr:ribokinase isoform X1 [Rhodamnia argentea]